LINRSLFSLTVVLLLTAASGASCPQMLRQYAPPAPVVFHQTPTLNEIINVVNSNSAPIQQLQTRGATLTVPDLRATLQADIALQRPRRFRMLARTGFTGTEMDIGSNDTLFWLWMKQDRPPSVYYCRHDQFTSVAMGQIIPIQPHWLIEALGVVHLDPADRHEGPIASRAGRLEIRSTLSSPSGDITRVMVIDATYGWVLEQHIYDWRGQHLASAISSDHRYDPVVGVSLPRRVEIKLPPAQMAFTIDIADYVINSLDGDPAQLWTMPQPSGNSLVNLAEGGR